MLNNGKKGKDMKPSGDCGGGRGAASHERAVGRVL